MSSNFSHIYICICLTFGSKLRSLWRNFLYSKYLMNKYVNYRYSTVYTHYRVLYSTAVLYSIVVYLIFGYSQKCFTVGDFSVPGSKVGKIRWLSWKIVCLAGQIVFEIWYILQCRKNSAIVMWYCLHRKLIRFEILIHFTR